MQKKHLLQASSIPASVLVILSLLLIVLLRVTNSVFSSIEALLSKSQVMERKNALQLEKSLTVSA